MLLLVLFRDSYIRMNSEEEMEVCNTVISLITPALKAFQTQLGPVLLGCWPVGWWLVLVQS